MTSDHIIVFLFSISVMLLFAKIFGEIFVKINQPAIIGEILAGIILGPTVLGMIFPDFFNWLFPNTNEVKIALDGITTLAVILLLLVSGIEVDLSIVLRHRKTAASTSIIGIIIPFIMGFVIAYLFPNLMGIVDREMRLVFALFIGTAIAISSLPVIAKILMDLNIFKTQLGFIIISAAMLNDLIGWLIFSVIIGMVGASSHGFVFSETLIYIFLFIIFILLFGRQLIDKLIPIIQNKISFPGGILNFVLILGFLGAAFTEYIGIHSILGAFIIGIAIGDSVHLKEETREVIQQFITNIFAPLFFVSIGLRVNFITSFNLLIVVTLLIIALTGKVVGSALGARLGGLSKNDSLAVGFGMSSSGAMGIIIGLLALQYGLIQEEVFVGLVIMALFTSIVSAPLMNYFLNKGKGYKLSDFISFDKFIISNSTNKNDVLKELTDLATNKLKIDGNKIYKELLLREESNPTGISNYLAIPHVRVKISEPIIGIALNRNGINFEAQDNLPAKIIFLLLTPESNNELQLQLLAEIVKKFNDRTKVEELLDIQNEKEFIHQLKHCSSY